MTWKEVIAEARKRYSGKYRITANGKRVWMDSRFSSISIEIEKGDGSNIFIKSDSWIDATGINNFLIWLENNGYICKCTRNWPNNK
jgi:hypothetical protein